MKYSVQFWNWYLSPETPEEFKTAWDKQFATEFLGL